MRKFPREFEGWKDIYGPWCQDDFTDRNNQGPGGVRGDIGKSGFWQSSVQTSVFLTPGPEDWQFLLASSPKDACDISQEASPKYG